MLFFDYFDWDKTRLRRHEECQKSVKEVSTVAKIS